MLKGLSGESIMVDVRVHLRFDRGLLPAATLGERRQLYIIEARFKTVADVVADVSREWGITKSFFVSIRGSRVRTSARASILRDDDVLELQTAPALALPASHERAICVGCGCNAPERFSRLPQPRTV